MPVFRFLSFALFSLFCFVSNSAADDLRMWKRKDGKVAKGTILEKTDTIIKMRLPDLKVVDVPIADLSVGDQAYIKAWSPPPPPKPDKAPDDAVFRNGMWFAAIKGRVTWHDAKKRAERMGATLATAETKEDHAFFATLMGERDYFWIGAWDEDEDGVWEWSDGRPLRTENWDRGEPSNRNQGRHYVLLRASGKWDDTVPNSSYITGFIVQWPDS